MNFDRIIALRNNKTIYRDGDKAIKVFRRGYPKERVMREACYQCLARSLGLNVPEVYEVIETDGKTAIVSEFIGGRTLADIMRESPEKQREMLELLADINILINSKPAGIRRLEDHINDALQSLDIPAETADAVNGAGNAEGNAFLHGELVPENIIIADDGTPYVLDWVNACRGDAKFDYASAYLSFLMSGNEEAAQIYMETVCAKTNAKRDETEKWVLPAAVSLAGEKFGGERRYLLEYLKEAQK